MTNINNILIEISNSQQDIIDLIDDIDIYSKKEIVEKLEEISSNLEDIQINNEEPQEYEYDM